MFIKSARLLAKLVLPAAGVVVDGLGGLASGGNKSGGGIDPEDWMKAYAEGVKAERRVNEAYAAGRKAGHLEAAGVEGLPDVFADEVSATGSAPAADPLAVAARSLFTLGTVLMTIPSSAVKGLLTPVPPKPVS